MFCIEGRDTERGVLVCTIARTGNVIAAIGILELKDIDSYRIDIRSVTGDLHSTFKRLIAVIGRVISGANRRAQRGPEGSSVRTVPRRNGRQGWSGST